MKTGYRERGCLIMANFAKRGIRKKLATLAANLAAN